MINFGTEGHGVMIWNDYVAEGGRYFLNIARSKKFIEWLSVETFKGS
jgi:hypothetical protein